MKIKRFYAPFERHFEKVSTQFERFLHAQTTTGIVLMITTIIALILANLFYESYSHFFHIKLTIAVGDFKLSMSLHHWINDALMAIFFFIIGLEIKREILVGELSNIKASLLPIIAAIGGMIMPALIYFSINHTPPYSAGWGIPMATDIAFAISALVLLRKYVPASLVTFLVALAIVDDLGAVVVIALFYTAKIHFVYLFYAFLTFLVLIVFNLLGIRRALPYFIVGVVMWYFMLLSGIHATIAGVIAALAIPMKPKYVPTSFSEEIKSLVDEYEKCSPKVPYLPSEKQKAILHKIETKIYEVSSPAQVLEEKLHLPVALIVIPLFALANAGIKIDFANFFASITHPVSLGVMAGLIIGKPLGIFGFSYLAIKSKIANLPSGATFSKLLGVAFLAGIGFTMSIFIADLAFKGNSELIAYAKNGIILGSLIATILGIIWLKITKEVK
ncbi:Na+/H+ antiporter NhaA [Caminibacter sp.]